MTVVQQNWRRFTKDSYTYQLARKIEMLKKKSNVEKKLCYNSPCCNVDLLKHELATKQSQTMKILLTILFGNRKNA